MSIKVNYATFKQALLELVEANGSDYVYKPDERNDDGYMMGMCENVQHDDEGNLVGSCIVGSAMVLLGVDPLAMASDAVRYADAGELLATLEDSGLIEFEPKGWDVAHTKELLLTAQVHQDKGAEWGESVETAIRRVEKGLYSQHFEDASA